MLHPSCLRQRDILWDCTCSPSAVEHLTLRAGGWAGSAVSENETHSPQTASWSLHSQPPMLHCCLQISWSFDFWAHPEPRNLLRTWLDGCISLRAMARPQTEPKVHSEETLATLEIHSCAWAFPATAHTEPRLEASHSGFSKVMGRFPACDVTQTTKFPLILNSGNTPRKWPR